MADLGFWEKKSSGGGSVAPGSLQVDVTFTTDNSGSMSAFQDWLFDPATAIALNDALVENGIGSVNQADLDDANCNRIATSKYSEMLQLAYRDLIVVQMANSLSGLSSGTTTYSFNDGSANYSGYTLFAWNNRQFVFGLDASNASSVSVGSDYIEFSNHKLGTGDKVVYNNGGGGSIGGLTSGDAYYVIRVNNNRFRLASTKSDAIAGTPAINITALGSGTNHSFTGPYEVVLRETAGGGSTSDIPIGSTASWDASNSVLKFKRLSVPYTFYTPCDERIKYFWATNNNGTGYNPNTSSAGNATTPSGAFVNGIQEDSYNTIYNLYAVSRNGGDDYKPRSGARGIVVASSNQQSILSPALPTTPGGSYELTLKTLKDNNVSYVGMVGGYIASTIANRVEPYIRQAPDFGETGVPAADVRGFVPLVGAVSGSGLDLSSQATVTAGILNSIPTGWYRNVKFVLASGGANSTPNRIRSGVLANIRFDAGGSGVSIGGYSVSIGGYGFEVGDTLTIASDDPVFSSLNEDFTIVVSATEDEDYSTMGNTIIGGAFTTNEYRIIVMNGYNPSTGAGEATDYRVRELNLATFPDTMLGETGSFSPQSTIPATGYVDGFGKELASNATAGDTTLVLTDVSGISVGNYVYDITSSNNTLRIPYDITVTNVDSGTNTITLSHPINENIASGDTNFRVGPLARDTFGWDYINLARETGGAVYFMPGPHNWSSANVIGTSSSSPGSSSTYATNDWNTIAIFQTWKVTFGRSIGRVFGQYLFKTA